MGPDPGSSGLRPSGQGLSGGLGGVRRTSPSVGAGRLLPSRVTRAGIGSFRGTGHVCYAANQSSNTTSDP